MQDISQSSVFRPLSDDDINRALAKWRAHLPTPAEIERALAILRLVVEGCVGIGRWLTAGIAAECRRALGRLPPGTDPARVTLRIGLVAELGPPAPPTPPVARQQQFNDWVAATSPAPTMKQCYAWGWRCGISNREVRALRRQCPDSRLHTLGRRPGG